MDDDQLFFGLSESAQPSSSLEEENRRLKQAVADLTLDKHIPSDALRKDVGVRHGGAGWRSGFAPRWARALCARVYWLGSVGPAGIRRAPGRTNQTALRMRVRELALTRVKGTQVLPTD